MSACVYHPERRAFVSTLTHGELCTECAGITGRESVPDDLVVCVAASSVLDRPRALDAMRRLAEDCSPEDEVWLIREILEVAASVAEKLTALRPKERV